MHFLSSLLDRHPSKAPIRFPGREGRCLDFMVLCMYVYVFLPGPTQAGLCLSHRPGSHLDPPLSSWVSFLICQLGPFVLAPLVTSIVPKGLNKWKPPRKPKHALKKGKPRKEVSREQVSKLPLTEGQQSQHPRSAHGPTSGSRCPP